MTDHDIEQVDYGYGYQAQNSPQQHMTLKVDGSTLAIVLAVAAICGLVVGAILLPEVIDSRAAEHAARAVAKSEYAERDARVAIEKIAAMQAELARRGIHINLEDH